MDDVKEGLMAGGMGQMDGWTDEGRDREYEWMA